MRCCRSWVWARWSCAAEGSPAAGQREPSAQWDLPQFHLPDNFPIRVLGLFVVSVEALNEFIGCTMGDFEGEIDVQCNAVPKAKSYIYEMREHPDTAAPGPWAQAKIATRSSASINGLVPGKRYAFRIRALGPNELESPWSDEVTCMAP